MPKMRKFKFDDGKEVKEVEALSFKKAVKSIQGSSKAKMVTIEWTTKNVVCRYPRASWKKMGL